jgi:hypothetical protein
MTAALLFASIAVAAIVEAILLRRIVFHQAGGWATPNETFVTLLVWAAVPLVAAAVFVALALMTRKPLSRITRATAVVAIAGPLFGYIALAQYSHSTPGFMMVGFAVQCVAVLVVAIKLLMPPNSTPHPDARASAALDQPPSARAGERGR